MAILVTVTTEFGEEKQLYLRINSASISNHNVNSEYLVRGYISQDAFKAGSKYMHEEEVIFKTDITKNMWEQCYSELKKKYVNAVDVME